MAIIAESAQNNRIIEYFKQIIIQPGENSNEWWFSDLSGNAQVTNYNNTYSFKDIDKNILSIQTTDKQLSNITLEQGASYYISFSVPASNKVQKIELILTGTENDTEISQYLTTITVPKKTRNSMSFPFQFIFTPYHNNLTLTWVLQRNYFSERSEPCPNINNLIIKQLTNILQEQNDENKIYTITKIGLQGPVGTLFCLNGEPLRIGKNGIYELEENIDIKFFGVALNSNSYCIADLKYKEIKTGGE